MYCHCGYLHYLRTQYLEKKVEIKGFEIYWKCIEQAAEYSMIIEVASHHSVTQTNLCHDSMIVGHGPEPEEASRVCYYLCKTSSMHTVVLT